MDNYIQTDNTMMDTLVSELKTLLYGTVLKNEEKANEYESLESIKRADLYIACIENRVSFEMFTNYNRVVLEQSNVDPTIIDDAILNRNLIPATYRDTVLENMRKYYIDNYEEINNYYRMLAGLPNVNQEGIKIYQNVVNVDITKYIHEMNLAEINNIKAEGIMDELIEEYPDREYLKYINNSVIDVYTARKAQKFQLLYIPTISSPSIESEYRTKIERNRVYTMKTIYSEAYKFGSDYYDAFIEILIKIQTMVDVITNVPIILLKRDFFDDRSIRDIFESHGITYFESIPRKYQLSMIDNLNTLLMYKSSTKNMIDICSLFGFNDIQLFKYYLLKDRRMVDGQYIDMKIGDNILLFVGGLYKTKEIEYVMEDGYLKKTDGDAWKSSWDYDITIPRSGYITSQTGVLSAGQPEIEINIPLYSTGDQVMFFLGGVYKTEGTEFIISNGNIVRSDSNDVDWVEGRDYDLVLLKNVQIIKQSGILASEQDSIYMEDYNASDDRVMLFVGGLLKSQGIEYNLSGASIFKDESATWKPGTYYDIFILKDSDLDNQNGTLVADTTSIEITIPGYDGAGEDLEANYDLKFIKVPIDDSIDKYMRDTSYHVDYDDTVSQDPYWDGDMDHDEVRRTILEEDFNIVRSKYLSIDTVYDMSKLTFELAYFFAMIRDNKDLEDNLLVRVQYINQDKYFNLFDIIAYLYVLMYESVEIEDTILDTTSKILHVKGFNFDADLTTLESWVRENYETLESLGVDDFQIPDSDILTFENLMDIFVRNQNIYDHVVYEMTHANNYRIYSIYKKIYDSLMISRLNTEMYTTPEGQFCETYSTYLEENDPVLYQNIEQIRALTGTDKTNAISDAIGEVLFALENYIDTSDFTYLFSNIPSMSSELLKSYIYEVINFFKSYKTELLSINVIYRFNDRLDNKIIIIDDGHVEKIYISKSNEANLHFADNLFKLTTTLEKEEEIKLNDSLFISYF